MKNLLSNKIKLNKHHCNNSFSDKELLHWAIMKYIYDTQTISYKLLIYFYKYSPSDLLTVFGKKIFNKTSQFTPLDLKNYFNVDLDDIINDKYNWNLSDLLYNFEITELLKYYKISTLLIGDDKLDLSDFVVKNEHGKYNKLFTGISYNELIKHVAREDIIEALNNICNSFTSADRVIILESEYFPIEILSGVLCKYEIARIKTIPNNIKKELFTSIQDCMGFICHECLKCNVCNYTCIPNIPPLTKDEVLTLKFSPEELKKSNLFDLYSILSATEQFNEFVHHNKVNLIKQHKKFIYDDINVRIEIVKLFMPYITDEDARDNAMRFYEA